MSFSNENTKCVLVGNNNILELIGAIVIQQGEIFTVQSHLSFIEADVFWVILKYITSTTGVKMMKAFLTRGIDQSEHMKVRTNQHMAALILRSTASSNYISTNRFRHKNLIC